MKYTKILIHSAKPGMVVAEDVYSDSNILIIKAGTALTTHIITRLKFYSIYQLLIQEEEASTDDSSSNSQQESSYIERIRSSKEFKDYQRTYDAVTKDMSIYFKAMTSGSKEFNPTLLMHKLQRVINQTQGGIELFEMIHCMRDYDDQTYAHCINVALICHAIGEWLHWSDTEIVNLTAAGLLHDIGKLFIPSEIMNKPARLTPEEYNLIKTHTLQGYNFLKNTPLNDHIKLAALQHHERLDKTGYPLKIGIDQIDSYAKIVAIADVYDAMTAARSYRDPICPFSVINIFETEGILKYDYDYLSAFLKGVVQTYIHNTVRLNNGVEGEIIMINNNTLSKPVIQKPNGEFIDLSKHSDLSIESLL